MCLYPTLIKNRKYVANKKNGGVIPLCIDERMKAVPIGCGRCMECRKQEARKWQIRLLEDIKHNKNGKFITLTFSNESIKELVEELNRKKVKKSEKIRGYETDNEIATIATRRFLERWRKKHKKSLRHWLITELGHNGTENIHMHGIVWTGESMKEVEKHWKYGYVWTGDEDAYGNITNYVNEATVNYITKYVHKQDLKYTEYKPKILTSAGIGRGYMERSDWIKNKYKKGETREYYKSSTGHKIAMPVYWRNKIYSEEEREKLWIEKLDKEERWVGGEKISTKNGMEEYWGTVKYYREKNIRLGYQTNKIDWNQKKYEEERRTLLIQKRITEAEKIAPQAGECPPEGREHTEIKKSKNWE